MDGEHQGTTRAVAPWGRPGDPSDLAISRMVKWDNDGCRDRQIPEEEDCDG